jgi:hypothetical protein
MASAGRDQESRLVARASLTAKPDQAASVSFVSSLFPLEWFAGTPKSEVQR